MNTTKLRTAGVFLGTWLLRLWPFWVPVALAIFALHVGAPPGLWIFLLLVLLFFYFVASDDVTNVAPRGFAGALVVTVGLMFSAVYVHKSNSLIHNGVVSKNNTEHNLLYGFWHGDTVVQSTHQDLSYEVDYLKGGFQHSVRVGLSYSVPADVVLQQHDNGTTPDYKKVFSDGLEKAALLMIDANKRQGQPVSPAELKKHLQAQLGELSTAIYSILIEEVTKPVST